MSPKLFAVLLAAAPLASNASGPKPLDSYCGQAEVIIPGVSQDQFLKDLTERLRTQLDSVIVTAPDTLQSCVARCNTPSRTKPAQAKGCANICDVESRRASEPRSNDAVIVMGDKILHGQPAVPEPDGSGRQSLQNLRLQYVISEARSGLRVEAGVGIVSFPGSDHELVTQYTLANSTELQASLARMASRYQSPAVSTDVAPEHEAAVQTAISRIELGRAPLIYVLSDEIDKTTRAAVSSFRSVTSLGTMPRMQETGLPKGYALLRKADVRLDDAEIEALVGPTGPKLSCGSPITVRLKSRKIGWSTCERVEGAC